MKGLGDVKKILGTEIIRDRKKGIVCLSQKQYLQKVFRYFGIDNKSKSVSTPLAPHFRLSSKLSSVSNEERGNMLQVSYASLVGSLMYAMVCTRPDISHVVNMVSSYMHNPEKKRKKNNIGMRQSGFYGISWVQ